MQSRIRHSANLGGMLGSRGAFSFSSYWTSRSEEWITSRSGTDLIDVKSGTAKASILLPSWVGGGVKSISGDKNRAAEALFDGGSYTMFWRLLQHTTFTTAGYYPFTAGGGVAQTNKGVNVSVQNNRMRLYCSDGVNYFRPYITDVGLNEMTWGNGVFYLLIKIDFANKLFIASLYNSAGVEVGTPVSQDISTFVFNANLNYQNFSYPATNTIYHIEGFKKFSGLKTLTQCLNEDYITNLQIHVPLTYSGIDVSGNANHFVRNGQDATWFTYKPFLTYPLDYGWSIYRHDDPVTYPYYVVASNKQDATRIKMPSTLKSFHQTHEGSNNVLNMVDSKIRFVNDFFDRSNATIWADACRAASDYDASNTKDFHIDNLNQKTIYSWLNDGYRGRLIIKMTPNSIVQNQGGVAYMRDALTLDEIILLTADEKGSANKKALNYTGDNIGVLTALDAEGYAQIGTLKTTKGMFTIRIDDAYDDAYDNFRSVFAALGVHPTTNVHSSLPGTNNGTYYWMSWDRLRTLQSEGWEICSSGQYDNDWNTDVATDDVEKELYTSKSEIEAQNLICNHLVPNKHGISRVDVRYWAKKYGYKTCHAGYTYGSTHGCNPQAIDLFNLCAMYCDEGVGGTYNIDALNPAAEIAAIEAQLDYALANNAWAILYVHKSSANLITHLTTVIQYAQSIGLENVTLEGALANMSYQ